MKAVLVATVLISLLIGTVFVEEVKANPHIGPTDPSISILSPRYSQNETNSLVLHFTVEVVGDWDFNSCSRQAWYSLDGQANNSVTLTYEGQERVLGYPTSLVSGTTDLPDLNGFWHTIQVSIKYDYGNYTLNGHESFTFQTGMPSNYNPNTHPLLGSLIVLAMVASFSLIIFFGYRKASNRHRKTFKQTEKKA